MNKEKVYMNSLHALEELQENIRHKIFTIPATALVSSETCS
jgi:hypothetical protein